MKYRSRVDIIAMLLQAASRGATKTRLMYSAYISYSQLKEYLDFLQAKELIQHEDGGQLYKLTNNGVRFLQAYQDISDLINLEDNRKLQYLRQTLVVPRQRLPATG
jgi:predicted transcriptional regulator